MEDLRGPKNPVLERNMSHQHRLDSLSDEELLGRLTALVERHRQLDAEVVAHIAEIDSRQLFLGQACSSMFAYCTELLHLSEAEAYLRIAVARASRRFPVLLTMLGDGRLHLSGIAKLAPHLDAINVEELLGRAVHQSKREIEKLVAEVCPRPDVPARMRKLPARTSGSGHPRPGAVDADEGGRMPAEKPTLLADAGESALCADLPGAAAPPPFAETRAAVFEARGCGAGSSPGAGGAKIEPLAPARYKVEFTASAELRDKLARARALLRHKVSDSANDLAEVVDEAVTLLLAKLEARKFAKTNAPRKDVAQSDTSAASRTIPAAVKRAVFSRDEGRCLGVLGLHSAPGEEDCDNLFDRCLRQVVEANCVVSIRHQVAVQGRRVFELNRSRRPRIIRAGTVPPPSRPMRRSTAILDEPCKP